MAEGLEAWPEGPESFLGEGESKGALPNPTQDSAQKTGERNQGRDRGRRRRCRRGDQYLLTSLWTTRILSWPSGQSFTHELHTPQRPEQSGSILV